MVSPMAGYSEFIIKFLFLFFFFCKCNYIRMMDDGGKNEYYKLIGVVFINFDLLVNC